MLLRVWLRISGQCCLNQNLQKSEPELNELIELHEFQNNTSENFKIRVWLANVKPYTGHVQLCVDVNTTFASICKAFDSGALRLDYNVTEVPVVNDHTKFGEDNGVNGTVLLRTNVPNLYPGGAGILTAIDDGVAIAASSLICLLVAFKFQFGNC